MRRQSFDQLCDYLANDGGGFTLWCGAGASVAATRGALPTWNKLASTLGETEVDCDGDFPDRLERLSQTLGHRCFRKHLRNELIDRVGAEVFDHENLLQQAVIGARAGALVSFNIELFSATALTLLRAGQSFVPRTFRPQRTSSVKPIVTTDPGLISSPVYFPHGLLLEGNVVLTRSEYDRHVGSVAMTTAVHLCIGGDLVVVGMSLADAYLRDALLQNRAWLRNIFWIGETETFQFREWARVAEVTCVDVPNGEVWSRLARAILAADDGGTLTQWATARRDELPSFVDSLIQHQADFSMRLGDKSRELLSENHNEDVLQAFAQYCVDTGHDVPVELAAAINEEPHERESV